MGRLRLVRAPRVVVAPMLASSLAPREPPPAGPAWTFEPKLDGVRAVAVIGGDSPDDVSLLSRNGIDKRAQFPEIAEALAHLPSVLADPLREPIILDGEIVALDALGEPQRFQALQGRMHASRGVEHHRRATPSAFVVFDCLADGSGVGGVGDVPLTHLPWRHRRRRLERLLARARLRAAGQGVAGVVRLGETSSDGEAMLERARAEGWEGLIAKRVGSPYRAGQRTRDWLKLKIEGRQEFVIGGWTDPERSRPGFGALLLGVYQPDGTLRYAGRVGTGFTHAQLRDLRARLDRIARATPPFAAVPPRYRGAGVHWVEPVLVAEVKYTEWTADGHLRHPSFQGLRDDKDPRAVVREMDPAVAETPPPAPVVVSAHRSPASRPRGNPLGPPPLRLLTRLREIESGSSGSGTLDLPGGVGLSLTNLGRVVIPAARAQGAPAVTKGDLLRYYARIAPVLLPAIAGRPLVLKRHHGGAKGAGTFYQQHAPPSVPDGVRTALVEGDPKPRFVAADPATGDALATLLYVVQLGAVSIDPWHARLQSSGTPDYCIVDLDPGPRVRFAAVVDAALWVKEELDRLGLHALPKTSGASGMHVVVPLPPGIPDDAARLLAELVATRVAQRHPRHATIVRAVRARPAGTIYMDFLQNVRGKTVAAVYSARAEPGASVSTPLAWDEVAPGLDPRAFTIASVPERVADVGDLWAAAMRRGNTLDALLAATDPGAAPTRRRSR